MKLGRNATLVAVGIGVAVVLGWLVTSQGPLAAAKVTVANVEQGPLIASTFGIGTVEARRSYALGPTVTSRVLRVLVDQGDAVKGGQLVAELDPIDLADRVTSAERAAERAASTIRAAEAQLAEARSRAQLATSGARRYAELRAQGFVSQEAADAKAHEANAAKAGVDAAGAQVAAARRDHERAQADVAGVGKLRTQARLASPVDGVVSARLVEPGTTVVAGQAVVQVIDPSTLWVRARIDQAQSGGVRAGQPAEIVLRSDPKRAYRGRVQRVDWVSDAITEERIVNVDFEARPEGIPVGELVEVTIRVAELATVRSIPAAAVKRVDRQDGVWQVNAGRATFKPVKVGLTTLDGRSQILDGLADGDQVVVHSEQALLPDARVKVVPAIVRPGP
ncbi:MAG TPA: efflux RND transporter periplasmic adaptor subunit [Casimicrobiaceae bacterium]|nr:efflux RND transporter periplasmic adaptor subunit [Casimicrobiaceae bacterium]